MYREPFRRGADNRFIVWPEPLMVVIGARFRQARLQAGLNQRQVADVAGLSQSAVSRFERGKATGMSAERVVRMAAALGDDFPFGFCPHDHGCAWPRNPPGTPDYDEELIRRRIELELRAKLALEQAAMHRTDSTGSFMRQTDSRPAIDPEQSDASGPNVEEPKIDPAALWWMND